MKLWGRSKTDQPQPQPPAGDVPPTDDAGDMKGSENAIPKFNRRYPYRKMLLAILVLAVLGGGGYAVYTRYFVPASTKAARATSDMNKALVKGDKTQALDAARKALAYAPNDPGAIGAVASLTPNHQEAQQLYGRLLTIYQQNTKSEAPTPVTYWAEGNLAAKAGQTELAKQYYQKSIAAAESSPNRYYQSMALESQMALKELP